MNGFDFYFSDDYFEQLFCIYNLSVQIPCPFSNRVICLFLVHTYLLFSFFFPKKSFLLTVIEGVQWQRTVVLMHIFLTTHDAENLFVCSLAILIQKIGFPDSSVGKESACNAGDPGSIPGWGRSAGEGIGCPLQYSWASLMAQLVKNPPAMWETWIQSLGWEEPL